MSTAELTWLIQFNGSCVQSKSFLPGRPTLFWKWLQFNFSHLEFDQSKNDLSDIFFLHCTPFSYRKASWKCVKTELHTIFFCWIGTVRFKNHRLSTTGFGWQRLVKTFCLTLWIRLWEYISSLLRATILSWWIMNRPSTVSLSSTDRLLSVILLHNRTL